MSGDTHYDEDYFKWQKEVGRFGGRANLFKFGPYIQDGQDVLDFGCGGGYLLKNIDTHGDKIGIEINPAARETALKNGVTCLDDIRKVDEDRVDVLITNHALEHVDDPMRYIYEFKRVVRDKGKIVIVVPHEISRKVEKDDINQHLYTWSPQNLYNLLRVCGIDVIECKRLCHAWIPGYRKVQQIVGWKMFHRLCVLNSLIRKRYQTIAVGVVAKDQENGTGVDGASHESK